MRWLLGLWFLPITILVGWLVLAANDWSFGLFFFSRQMYDLVFAIYGETLGIPPESIPPLVVRALVVDSLIVVAIFLFRRRRAIAGWWRARQDASAVARSERSLSSAP